MQKVESEHPNMRPYFSAAAVIIIFFVFLFLCWQTEPHGHEYTYLLGSRRIFDPDFLKHDFIWRHLSPTSWLFDHLVAPLWHWFGYRQIIMLGRLFCWALLSYTLVLFCEATGRRYITFVLAIILWILSGQSTMADSKIVSSFEPKALAYPFFFMAAVMALNKKTVQAAMLSGLVILIHPIVGIWTIFTLGSGYLLNVKKTGRAELIKYILISGLISMPFLLICAWSQGVAGTAGNFDKIYVMFRVPHFTDPYDFIDTDDFIRIWGFIICSFFSVSLICAGDQFKRRYLQGVIAAITLSFVVGLIARYFELFFILKLYPFRFATEIMPFLFFVFTLSFLFSAAAYKKPSTIFLAFVIIAAHIEVALYENYYNTIKSLPARIVREYHYLTEDPPDHAGRGAMYAWIRKNTPADSIFITPSYSDFWMRSERAQVVSFRQAPLDGRINEWLKRLQDINRGMEFKHRGYRAVAELRKNQRNLSKQELFSLKEKYSARYYLTDRMRYTLMDLLVYSANNYYLYDLNKRKG
ncbi:MAG: hypothetical protein D6719_02530 [Candidatus Dadabacteria bacterium]|nr:MAG: hypothetical protein D6719_02530 [Candidatus Dadabacteria bacterium]